MVQQSWCRPCEAMCIIPIRHSATSLKKMASKSSTAEPIAGNTWSCHATSGGTTASTASIHGKITVRIVRVAHNCASFAGMHPYAAIQASSPSQPCACTIDWAWS